MKKCILFIVALAAAGCTRIVEEKSTPKEEAYEPVPYEEVETYTNPKQFEVRVEKDKWYYKPKK